MPKSEFASRDYYDVWLPVLSPQPETVKRALNATTEREWNAFVKRFRAEMKKPDAAATLNLLAALSKGSDFSIGCYCEDESHCHRSVLRELLKERGANLK